MTTTIKVYRLTEEQQPTISKIKVKSQKELTRITRMLDVAGEYYKID